jgi:T5orf172 domain
MEQYFLPEPWEHWAGRPLAERLQYIAWSAMSFDRRRREYKRMGWVYAMHNPALKDRVFKVGLTKRFPTERAEELSKSTGVYGRFELIYFVHVGDRQAAESEAHRILDHHRVTRGKEFFEAPLSEVLQALDTVSGMYPVWAGPKRKMKPLVQPFLMFQGECQSCGSKVAVRELMIPVRTRCNNCGAEL